MIAITGATGHIGNVLVRELLAKGYKDIRVLVFPKENMAPLEGLPVEKVFGDITNLDSLIEAFKGADVVYHLAAIISILPGKNKLLNKVNVEGTKNVIEACKKNGVRRLVYTSSIHALFVEPPPKVIDETLPFDPENIIGEYAQSKVRATQEAIKASKEGLDTVIVCPTGVLGPYDFRPSETGQLMIDFARKKLRFYIDGNQDFADVRDTAAGIILACEKGKNGEVYILSGETISVENLLNNVKEVMGFKSLPVKIPIFFAKIASWFTSLYYIITNTKPALTPYSIYVLTYKAFANDAKARQELGYTSRPLNKSIKETINWFKETGKL